MPPIAGKRKPSEKAPSRPPSDQSTPEDTIYQQESASQDTSARIRAQISQQASDTLGTPVQLSDSQFATLLERLAPPATNPIVPTIETPLISQSRRDRRIDLGDSESDS